MTNVSVQGNYATNANNGYGGGIYVGEGTTTLVSGCTVSGNTAAAPTGGNGICRAAAATLVPNLGVNDITDDIQVD